ncbi:unnamed protein product [Withania somnifera]
MATENGRALRKRKRKENTETHRILGFDQKVEVRSVEDGFLGSWHAGTVIDCYDLVRRIEYDHILSDRGSRKLVELINVSPILDGVVPDACEKPVHHFGIIRPLPPPREFGRWPLPYGQCVDFLYQDAWWEGVIFDREEGDEERRIFFPEMGDEMKAKVDKLRLSQDWDEVTEEWKPRGSWIFLEVVEEIEKLCPLFISVKQIWYEVQVKHDYDGKLKHWTSSLTDVWRKLAKEVVLDNTKLTIKQFFSEMNSSQDFAEGEYFEFSELAFEGELNFETLFDNSIAPFTEAACTLESAAKLPMHQDVSHLQLPTDQDDSHLQPVEKQFVSEDDFAPATQDVQLCGNDDSESIPPSQKEDSSVSPHDFSVLPPPSDGTGILSSTMSEPLTIVNSKPRRGRPPSKKKRIEGQTMVSEPDSCPETTSKKTFKKPPSDESAGILSSSKSELATLANSKPRRGRPPTKKKKLEGQTQVGEPDSCQEATSAKGSDDITGRLPTRKKNFSWQTRTGEPGSCPEAIAKYMPSLTSKKAFQKYLLTSGWKFEIKMVCGSIKKCYIAPDGKVCESIRQVRQVLEELKTCGLVPPVEQSSLYGDTDNSIQSPCMEGPQPCNEVPELPYPSEETIIEPEICRQAVIDYCLPKDVSAYQKSYRYGVRIGDTSLKAKKYLAATGWKFYSVGKNNKGFCYCSPEGKTFVSFRKACKWCVQKWEAESHLPEQVSSPSTATKNSCESERSPVETPLTSLLRKPIENGKSKRRMKRKCGDLKDIQTGGLPELKGNKSGPSLKKGDGDMQSSKRARKVAPSSSNQTPRTVLSWLIDNNVVLPRAKVQYCRKKNGNPMAEGRITREGIKCNCCQKNFGLRNFEAHAGSSCNRPSENIYLEDGRSLLECQMQMKNKLSVENKHDSCFTQNDYICSVCHYGGDLILCDGCLSSFHPDCLGIKDVPEGDWFCPSCCCKVCGKSRSNTNENHFTDNAVLACCQCDHKYHARCLRSKGPGKLDKFLKGNWFCNKRCELICLGMRHLLEKPVIVGDDNLTWTLLKYTKSDDHESSVEVYSRLRVALTVMHECFEQVKEPLTGRDIAEDVIFSRWSKLNRLNFKGFYTVLLERNDELITVAVVRVYGEKVAEIPLVATQFQHRRLGMCRILINELEKKLRELGVERLVLPAVPAVLNTWITSFGFSVVEPSERANFFDYTFLDFQGTIMCQKILQKIPAATQQTHFDNANSKDNVELDDNTVVSEVLQTTQVEGCATVDQGPMG